MSELRIAPVLLKWYRRHGRSLPWRGQSDPYVIWVSEIMLQQTRVETVIPYFEHWMERFPNVQSLAKASENEVLKIWEGLGYYSRARNLHKTARIVTKQHKGKLPRDPELLRKLPGIGRYTAGAIASIAFGLDEPVLDGNLRRVYSRVYDVKEYADSPAGQKTLWDLAGRNLPKGRAGGFNQAMMDLGSKICTPRNPKCASCPIRKHCLAYENGTQTDRPVLKPRRTSPHYLHAAGVIFNRGRVLLARRPDHGLLGGMWEFPNGRVKRKPALEASRLLEAGYRLKVRRGLKICTVNHVYSHFSVTVHVFRCVPRRIPRRQNLRWVHLTELEDYPMGGVDRRIARKLTDV